MPAANHQDIQSFITMATAFSQMSYQGVYLFDFTTSRFLYASNHPLLLGKASIDDFYNKGIDVFQTIAERSDWDNIQKIKDALTSGFRQMPTEMKSHCVISFTMRIKTHTRSIIVTHKMSMLQCDAQGIPTLALGMVSPSVGNTGGDVMVQIPSTATTYSYSWSDNKWMEQEHIALSAEEQTMLRLSMQGFTVEKIANIMCRSVNTVKFYRKQVFQKFNVKSISEAIAYAIHNCLI